MKRKAKNSQTGPFDEEKYRTIFESIHEGFCIYEIVYNDSGKPVDLRWIEVNPAYEKQTGLTDVVGKRHSELGLATEQYWYDIYDQVARTGEAVHFENWHEPTGRWYHVFTSRIGGAESKQVAVLFEDITERKRREAYQEYLLKLNDALRPLADSVEIQRVAMNMLGEYLKVDRLMYTPIENEETIVANDNYVAEGVQKVIGRFPVAAFGTAIAKLKRGEMVVIDDVNLEGYEEAELNNFYAMNAYAALSVPLIKDNRLVATLGAQQGKPRKWTADEIALFRETAERTWAAVERARAEAALRENEERQRFLVHFGDILRSLTGDNEILQTAARLLGEYLHADRTFFGELFEAEDLAIMHLDYARGDLPSLAGRYKISDFQETVDALQGGQAFVINDVANSERLSENTRSAYLALGYASFLSVPLFKRGRLVLNLSAVSSQVRSWTANEIQITQEIAERTWTIVERARAEEALRESERRLQLLNTSLEERVYVKTAELRAVASELTKAEQRERDRISHILHDDLQQQIYSVLMQFSTLRNRLSAQDEAVRQEAIDLEMQMREVLKVARNLSIDLNPPILPGEGLLHAIQWLAGQMLERYSLPVEVQAEDSVVLSDHELHVLLFNCVRELLFNVVKHADASHAAVRLQKADGNLHIEIRDNGKGFSTNLPWQMENQTIALKENLPLSFGLSTIGHKLSLYGGTMLIASKVGEGTQITLVVPVAKNGSA